HPALGSQSCPAAGRRASSRRRRRDRGPAAGPCGGCRPPPGRAGGGPGRRPGRGGGGGRRPVRGGTGGQGGVWGGRPRGAGRGRGGGGAGGPVGGGTGRRWEMWAARPGGAGGSQQTSSSTGGPPRPVAPCGRAGDVIVPINATRAVHDEQCNSGKECIMLNYSGYAPVGSGTMHTVDDTDRRILLAM